jgi:transposase-like protein
MPGEGSPERLLAEELVERAHRLGVSLVGLDGPLAGLAKTVLEAGLEAELTGHLDYPKHDPRWRNHGNSRNGTRTKTVLTDVGPIDLEVLAR